jgi:Helitron helicase-like domain at N-terminus/PIF1-like helicase
MSVVDIITRVNDSIGNLYIKETNDKLKPLVCIVCDRFIRPACLSYVGTGVLKHWKHLLQPNPVFDLDEDLKSDYTLSQYPCVSRRDHCILSVCLLSPRATYVSQHDKRKTSGFTICSDCNSSLKKGLIPMFAIVNNYAFGQTPTCLSDLTDVELAMITPVKSFGYCFTYTGGLQKQLKGTLSYYKISTSTIAKTAATLDSLQLHNQIVIITYGNLTRQQEEAAKKKYTVNAGKIILAIRWLLQHNTNWKPYASQYNNIIKSIGRPILIEKAKIIETSETQNSHTEIENTVSFQVFYPDGSVSVTTGGKENIDEFQEVVQKATKEGYRIEYRMNVLSEAVADYKENNLVKASLLQFPYGVGGLSDIRLINNSNLGTTTDLLQYTHYLSMQSLAQFQKELFTLQVYNMQLKFLLMRSAFWKLRNEHFAEFLTTEITTEQVDAAIHNKRRGTDYQLGRGNSLLGAIDAICKSVPHTNEAANVARRQMETMQHHFGCPTFFLTVTPDDDNHILIQILSGTHFCGPKYVDEMTDDENFKLSSDKTELRIKFPGVCAFFFELMLEIVLRDVIGWDRSKNAPVHNFVGIFGELEAVSVSVEEQGRRTLHAHILIWEESLKEKRNLLFTATQHVRRQVKKDIISKIDSLSAGNLFFSGETSPTAHLLQQSFPHACADARLQQHSYPIVVSNQELRYLRCKRKHECVFAYCKYCNATWSQTDLVSSYLQHHIKVPNIGLDYHSNIRRLKNKTTEFQYTTSSKTIAPTWMVDAAYNHHVHAASCFKHKFDVHNKSALCEECRYRYPQIKRRKTILQNVTSDKQPWYLWNGTTSYRHIKEICPRRTEYNLFQNVCCPHISYSCNTNISFLLPGPVAQYCVSYTMKNTQKEETQEYELVRAAIEKILSKTKDDDTSGSIAIRRLMRTTFAHQSNNIVGAPMASYLTRNSSRFYFSHTFSWCPLRDLRKLICGEKIYANVTFTQYTAYFESLALNYVCRPRSLNNTSVFDFFTKYDVVRVTTKNRDTLLHFHNNSQFQHPSYNTTTKQFRQAIQEKKKYTLAKIYQHDFPDTATFGGDITNINTKINDYMEQYSMNVLLLFYPFRNKADLLLNNSYTEKLRKLVHDGTFTEPVFSFLQNLQDCKSNNLRNVLVGDELQRTTLQPDNNESSNTTYDNTNTFEEEQLLHFNEISQENDDLEDFLADEAYTEPNYNDIPTEYTCSVLRSTGRHGCGFSKLPDFSTVTLPNTSNFVTSAAPSDEPFTNIQPPSQRPPPKREDLVSILFLNTAFQQRSFLDVTGQTDLVSVLDPNGSAKSIVNWAEASTLDSNQQRAFEIMTSTFVLSYYNTPDIEKDSCAVIEKEKDKLRILAHNKSRETDQLICFLHGPGGSGKTAVINLLLLYAHSFCKLLWADFDPSERVIVVTALTGVAATLLNGETTHSALYLNQRKPITREQVEIWFATKMVIIDEISFASKADITLINSKLGKLKQKPYQRFGGVNLVFCGDFRQLEPVGANKRPIYCDNVPEFRDWINCYIELRGIWRFKNDLPWGRLLHRIRNGSVTKNDIIKINNQIRKNKIIPAEIRYACYHNIDRDAINTAIFEERLKSWYRVSNNSNGFLIIFSDNIYVKDSNNVYKRLYRPKHFWESYGAHDIKMPHGTTRMDPVLKLFLGCKVMLPSNINVAAGLANGTQAVVHKIILKNCEATNTTTISNIPVAAVFASQVEAIQLHHCNERHQPQTFFIQPTNHTFKLGFRQMKATQVPILLNNATTGHKLQGTGVNNLFVHNWSYVTNWIYVMLSRVKSLSGLYARNLLSTDITKYDVKKPYKTLISKLRKQSPHRLSEDEYTALLS